MKIVKFSRLACIIVSLSLAAPAFAASTARLKNDRLTAEFGPRGLAAIASPEGRFTFASDDFALSISGQAYDSRKLPTPKRVAGKDGIAFEWAAGSYRITILYELRAGWSFVSKQITIAAPSPVRVDEVTPVLARLSPGWSDSYVPKSPRPSLGTGDYGVCLRVDGRKGLLAVVQNPFLRVELRDPADPATAGSGERRAVEFAIHYRPEIDWNPTDGPFIADRALFRPYRPTGRKLPARMVPEWSIGANDAGPGMDEAEIDAFTSMVRAFVLARPSRPVNVLVPWCLNDYQIDVATREGREEYKRIFDSGAALGAEYVIFAPTNSDLARREDSADDWSWENLLWLGFGQKLRRNEWDVKSGPVPASVQEMLDYAKSKNLKLLAYVYPVLPFSQNPAWLDSRQDNPSRRYANLGFRSFQDWLIETLVAFHDRFGLGGYSFDHTFLTYPATSRYAQWAGWRRVMEELRRRVPDIVIDGRQAYHQYGPWSWLAGSYPHPTANDEQPESFVPFPDLHFDRVSADRERYTAYRYRNYEFAPSELVPGFITHQTSRGDDTGEMPQKKTDKGIMLLPFRQRDWDYLGWRYSLLSSIAIAGWNNVLDMIPARDPAEYGAFAEADRKWFRGWIDWTAANKEYLRHTRTILGQPGVGNVDGTSALVGDRGYIFLFNPNGRRLSASFRLDETIGLGSVGRAPAPSTPHGDDASRPPNRFLLKELHPQEGRLIGKPGAGLWQRGDQVELTLDGASAMVLEVLPAPAPLASPLLFNVKGTVTGTGDGATIADASGEAGTEVEALLLSPSGGGAKVRTETLRFAGAPFAHNQQVGAYDPSFAGGRWTGSFSVPERIFEQLAARQKAWPIPWRSEDYRTTWLAPQRLLLFVQIAEPDDKWEASLRIDGKTVELKKAYSAVRVERRTFVGFYADLSLVAPDATHTIELDLPRLKPGQMQGVFFENVETEYAGRTR